VTRQELLRREYLGRIERAVDFIYARFGDDIGLDEIADAAAFSRFHFHRVFSGVVGETVSDFLKRVRLQRAAALLADNPGLSVTEIALASGFSSPSVFARAFRERFGMTASEWRDLGREGRRNRRGSKQGQTLGMPGQGNRKVRKAAAASDGYPPSIVPDGTRRKDMPKLSYKVEIKDLPELTVAYARHVGPFDGIPEAFGRLARWAGPRGLFARPGAKTLAVYHDSPEATETGKLRSSACLTVPPGTEVSGDINLMTIPGGTFAVARFEIAPDQFGEAWDALMGEWFPSSGWQPDDRMCYEVYLTEPDAHPEGRFVIDICEPVRPL
jgi:AraC family transcriptional regulator